MAVFKRGDVWWFEFIFAGKRFRESAQTGRKTVAKEAEANRRAELERTLAGMPVEKRENRILSVGEIVGRYRDNYPLTHRPSSVAFSRKRLAWVERHMGTVLLGDLNEDRIRAYMRLRQQERAAGRTINMELGELSRAIGKDWSVLWPEVRKLEERKDVGRAITQDEERRLLAAAGESRLPLIASFIRIALTTGMRAGEITSLTWGQVDLEKQTIRVGRAKTAAGTGRMIPMNGTLFAVFSQHAAWFVARFGELKPEWFVFASGAPTPNDPSKPATNLQTSWENARDRAGVSCRFHDLRHTAISRMAEAGVPDAIIMALAGHVSRSMLERYSHISLVGKRRAVEALEGANLAQNSDEVPTNSPTVARPN